MAAATESGGIIAFRDVEKRFGSLTVLRGLNLTIGAGERVSLIGPSGSGKTTILRILMTLEPISAGEVLIGGTSMYGMRRGARTVPANEAHLRRVRERIGMVFQQFNLFPHMTALENVVAPQMMSKGTARAEATDRARALLATVGLAEKANEYPLKLSGGQKQRVAIARALAMEPEIILFDEVTSALDPELVDEVLSTIRELSRTTDMTMLFVTHEMSFAREISDRVLFFDRGQVVEEGPPAALFGNPSQPRTQQFLRKIVAAGQRIE